MKDIFRKQLDELIKKNVRLFNLQMKKKRDEPFLLCEEYHLSTGIENELFSWELQQTIGITENGKIHMMMFMHPIIVDDNNHREFIEFAKQHTEYMFLVTPIACGIAGFKVKDIAPLFTAAKDVNNIALPLSFWYELQ